MWGITLAKLAGFTPRAWSVLPPHHAPLSPSPIEDRWDQASAQAAARMQECRSAF